MSTEELVAYYAGLLIIQYLNKPNATGSVSTMATAYQMAQTTVRVVTFSPTPSSGQFKFGYDGNLTPFIAWNASAATVQTAIQSLILLAATTVTGSMADGFTITFTGILPVALPITIESSTLDSTGTITETDLIIPLAVQDGFNLNGDSTAVGVQLDALAKYAGVTRTAQGFTQQITLDDSDFLSLIRLAVIKNSAGSSLAEIQQFIHQAFPGAMLVFDYQNMQMSYLISTSIGSADLVQLFVTQGLLPKPMAVGLALVIYAPIIDAFFGFRTYELPAFNATPFNSYVDYHEDWPWLSYANAVIS